jgi:hypothetical protein
MYLNQPAQLVDALQGFVSVKTYDKIFILHVDESLYILKGAPGL